MKRITQGKILLNLGLLKIIKQKDYDMGSINLQDAVRDMERNGEDLVFSPTPSSPLGSGRAPSAIYVPPVRPSNGPIIAPPITSEVPQSMTITSNDRFIFMEVDDEGRIIMQVKTEEEVKTLIDEIGIANVLTTLPDGEPSDWAGKVLIIRGTIVCPRPVVTYVLEAF